MKIESITKIERNNEPVFNLEVEDNNNYFANGILVSNCHKLKRDNKFNKIIKKVKTLHKFGFTGTLPEDLLDKWNVIGKIGPVIFEKSGSELEKENYIAPVKAIILKLHYNNPPRKIKKDDVILPTQNYIQEVDFLIHNNFRNNTIAALCKKFDNNCLILVNYIEHGEILFNHLKKHCLDKKVFFIRGEVEVEERQKVIEMMEKQKDVVCVAISKIFSVGINIKQLCYLIFASGGKAKVRVVQSIGRGRRLHENKESLFIFDIADQLEYGMEHSSKRNRLYEQEKIPFAYKDIRENTSIVA